jgi:hypothetical protein
MADNLDLWNKLGKTDPAHTKQFKRAGGFSGTAIKPMWAYRRMTEEFGPCGVGWGVYEPTFQVVPGPEGEVLVYCTASIWYENPEQRSWGVGGDKVVSKNKYGLNTDDEAFKKAFTDAITNALKMIGVGADVHMGMFDDNKYVNTMRDEFAGEAKHDAAKPKVSSGLPKPGPVETTLIKAIDLAETVDDLTDWAADPANSAAIKGLAEDARQRVRAHWAATRTNLLPPSEDNKDAA